VDTLRSFSLLTQVFWQVNGRLRLPCELVMAVKWLVSSQPENDNSVK
jgi:hypothetical protein